MGKKHRNLMPQITSDSNMRNAYRRTSEGRRLTLGFLEFKEFAPLHLTELAADIQSGDYRQGQPREFMVFEPKARLITALSFRDRVAQHALCNIIGPIFERTFLPRSYACRPGFGTHAGVVALQAEMRREGMPLYFLKTDFSRFFASIDCDALHGMIRKKISCAATLQLIEAMVPPTGVGLPIGSLTSQLFANVYAGALDRHLQCNLGERCWHRYMDDLVVLGRSSGHLDRVRREIEHFSADRLGLRFSKWSIAPVTRGVNFLGYRIWPRYKLLRRQSVVGARRKIAAYRAAGDAERLEMFLAAWLGHARWADTANLIKTIMTEMNNETDQFAGRS